MINYIMYYVGMGMAIMFGITTIVMFIVFNIPRVIKDLSGITAKREIKNLSDEQRKNKRRDNKSGNSRQLFKSQTQKNNETQVLTQSFNETQVLGESITTKLSIEEGSEQTTMLNGNMLENKFEIITDIVFMSGEII